ncbi:MAG: pilus assembly protein PilM [Phycisphaerales bacterium]
MKSSPFSGFSSLSKLLASPLGGKSAIQVSPVGIDFGVGSLKMVQSGGSSGGELVGVAGVETPPELYGDHNARLKFQLAQLPRLMKEGGFKGRRVVCAIPNWRVMCKHLQVTRVEGVPLPVLIESAMPAQLGCDPLSVLHRDVEVGLVNGRTEVIVIATPREFIDRLVRGLTSAKLEPVGMHSEFTSTLRAFDGIHRRDKDMDYNTLYLDIGAGTTNVMVAHGTGLAFARVISVGGLQIDRAIAQTCGCSPAEARAKRLALGLTAPPPPRPAAAAPDSSAITGVVDPTAERRVAVPPQLPGLSPEVTSQPASPVVPEGGNADEALEILADEVQMCLRYHASQHPSRRVDRVIFVGGEARHRGLCQHLTRVLKLPGFMADPLSRLTRRGGDPCPGVDLGLPQPAWAVAMGLCMSPTDL